MRNWSPEGLNHLPVFISWEAGEAAVQPGQPPPGPSSWHLYHTDGAKRNYRLTLPSHHVCNSPSWEGCLILYTPFMKPLSRFEGHKLMEMGRTIKNHKRQRKLLQKHFEEERVHILRFFSLKREPRCTGTESSTWKAKVIRAHVWATLYLLELQEMGFHP